MRLIVAVLLIGLIGAASAQKGLLLTVDICQNGVHQVAIVDVNPLDGLTRLVCTFLPPQHVIFNCSQLASRPAGPSARSFDARSGLLYLYFDSSLGLLGDVIWMVDLQRCVVNSTRATIKRGEAAGFDSIAFVPHSDQLVGLMSTGETPPPAITGVPANYSFHGFGFGSVDVNTGDAQPRTTIPFQDFPGDPGLVVGRTLYTSALMQNYASPSFPVCHAPNPMGRCLLGIDVATGMIVSAFNTNRGVLIYGSVESDSPHATVMTLLRPISQSGTGYYFGVFQPSTGTFSNQVKLRPEAVTERWFPDVGTFSADNSRFASLSIADLLLTVSHTGSGEFTLITPLVDLIFTLGTTDFSIFSINYV